MNYRESYPRPEDFEPQTEEERLGEERMSMLVSGSMSETPAREISIEDKALIEEIGRLSARNRIAIAHADRVLKESAEKQKVWQEEMKESDRRTEEAVKVLRRAGLLR